MFKVAGMRIYRLDHHNHCVYPYLGQTRHCLIGAPMTEEMHVIYNGVATVQ